MSKQIRQNNGEQTCNLDQGGCLQLIKTFIFLFLFLCNLAPLSPLLFVAISAFCIVAFFASALHLQKVILTSHESAHKRMYV